MSIVEDRGASAAALSTIVGDSRGVDVGGPTGRPFRPFPDDRLDRSVFEVFSAVAALFPEKTAIDDGESFVTYREAQRQAARLASVIAAKMPRGSPIGIALPNGTSYPVAMLAILAAGCGYVPLDLSFPEARNRLILTQAGMKAVIVNDETRDAMRHMDPALLQLDFAAEGPVDAAVPPSAADDFGFVIYTSGSTGQPKGAYFSQRSLLHDAQRRINSAHLSPDDRLALIFAPMVRAAQEDIFGALLSGATMFVVDLRRKGLQELIRVLRRGRITICFSVPYVYRRLVDLCPDPKLLETIRCYCLAGDRVFASDVELFRRHFPPTSCFSVGVGSTETNFYTHWFIPRDLKLTDPLVPVGYVPPGYEVSLVDASGRPVPRGEPGEFLIKGRYIGLGYWNDPELTRQAFTQAAGEPGIRLFRIGDLGRMRSDGLIELIGRKDRQIKIRGNRVEPAEIEATIRRHVKVSDAAVIPRGEGEAIELVAYVVAARGETLSSDELSMWLVERLPDAMRPKEINIVAEIPMLGNFKPDIIALRELDRRRILAPEPAAHPSGSSPTEAPHSAVEDAVRQAVAAAWRRLLGEASYASGRSWEQAGGNSALGMELIFDLEAKLCRPVAMKMLTPDSRPEDLVSRLLGGTMARCHAERRESLGGKIFFLPGLLGPILNIMRFAETLSPELDIEVLDFLPVDPAAPRPVELDQVIEDIAAKIRARTADGEAVSLLGYSMGGLIAYEAARLLAAEGRRIEFLGVVDYSPISWSTSWHLLGAKSVSAQIIRLLKRGLPETATPMRLLQRLVERQLYRQAFGALAWEWRLFSALGMRRVCAMMRQSSLLALRGKAVQAHAVKPYPGRIDLFRADNPQWKSQGLGDDLGWRAFSPQVVVWPVAGGHEELFQPDFIATTKAAILEALAATRDAA